MSDEQNGQDGSKGTEQGSIGDLDITRCRRCHRVLCDPVSIKSGIGKACLERETPSKRKRRTRPRKAPGFCWEQLLLFPAEVEPC